MARVTGSPLPVLRKPPRERALAALPFVHRIVIEDWYHPERRVGDQLRWRPGMTVADAMPPGWAPELTGVVVDRRVLLSADDPLRPYCTVTLVRRPGDPVSLGVAAFVIGAAGFLTVAGILAVAAFALLVQEALFGAPALPSFRAPDDDSSTTYGWSGIQTDYNGLGLPYPKVYGLHRTGGRVLNAFVDVSSDSTKDAAEDLLLLIALSTGPIEAIGEITTDTDDLADTDLDKLGLQINGNTASNFSYVTASVRMGNLLQAVIPGFENLKTQYQVGLLLDQESSSPATPLWDEGTGGYAQSFDMPSGATAEYGKLGFRFPGGLFEIEGNLQTGTETVEVAVRYRELDDVGTPIGNWVVVADDDSPVTIKKKIKSAFTFEFPFAFYDPATFNTPSTTNGVELINAQDQYGSVATPLSLKPGWADGFSPGTIALKTFVKPTSALGTGVAMPLWSWADTTGASYENPTTLKGWIFDMVMEPTGLYVPRLRWGDGSAGGQGVGWDVYKWNDPDTGVAPGEFALLAFVIHTGQQFLELHKGNVGVKTTANSNAVTMTLPGTDLLMGTVDGFTATKNADAVFDETVLYDRNLNYSTDIAPAWAGGLPNEEPEEFPDGGGFVTGWRFNTIAAGSPPTTDSFGVRGETGAPSDDPMDLNGSTDPVTQTGVVLGGVVNTIKKARYRIQCQRVDVKSSDADRQDAVNFEWFQAILDDELTYPGLALLGLRIRATDQLNTTQPTVTALVKGAKVPIWDGIDPDNPLLTTAWSNNPAWCLADLVLDTENGAGRLFGVQDVDWTALKTWGDSAAVLVYDQLGTSEVRGLGITSAIPPGQSKEQLRIRLLVPIATHFVVGKTVRLEDIDAAATDYDGVVDGDHEINDIVEVSATESELYVDWPGTVPGPLPADFLQAGTATLRGVEPRHALNLVLGERGQRFWDVVSNICALNWATPLILGNVLSVAFRRQRQPVAVFNDMNIIDGSFSLAIDGTRNRANSLYGEIQNERLAYERDVIPWDDPDLDTDASTLELRRRSVDMRGITSPGQARRKLRLDVTMAKLVSERCEFEAGLDALFLQPLDVFYFTRNWPQWEQGGRCQEDATADDEFVTDEKLVIGPPNWLIKTDDFNNSIWAKSNCTVTSNDRQLRINGVLTDFHKLEFASAVGESIQQVLDGVGANLPPGLDGDRYRFSLWLQADQAYAADEVSISIVTDSDSFGTAVGPSLSTTPTLFSVTGELTTDVVDFAQFSIRMDAKDSTAVTVWASQPWVEFAGQEDFADDVDPHAFEHVDTIPSTTYTAAIRNGDSDSVETADLTATMATYLPGDTVPLASSLSFVPAQHDVFVVGPGTTVSRRFEIIDISLEPDFTRKIRAQEYRDDVFFDEDDFQPFLGTDADLAVVPAADDLFGTTKLPAIFENVTASEETAREVETGKLTRSVLVSWSIPGGARSHVDHVAVWVIPYDSDGTEAPPIEVGRVRPPASSFRIHDSAGLVWTLGARYDVIVQPVAFSGLRRPLDRLSRAPVTPRGVFPIPDAPAAAALTLHGEQASYEVTLADGFEDHEIEIRRGGTFLGQVVGHIPRAGRVFGPTLDWCALEAAADGRQDPVLYFRPITPTGARGKYVRISTTLAPVGFGTATPAVSFEDEGWESTPTDWTTAPVLSGLQVDTSTTPEHLKFTGSGLTGTWTSSEYDLGRPKRVHVSFGVEGMQIDPQVSGALRPSHDVSMRSFTAQGHTDPHAPGYSGEVTTELLWAHSLTDDPGTDFEPFRCGVYGVRSFQFRIQLTRPTDDWDVLLDRAGVAVREVPGEDPGEGL